MTLSPRRYRPSADALTRSETKSGSYIYDGTVNNFHEWEFRTEIRMSAAWPQWIKRRVHHSKT
eukprot:6644371-Pyramimonas_sp.AAC.1